MASNKEKSRKIIGGVALGLALLLFGGVGIALCQRHFGWGEISVENPTAPGGMVVGESHGNGIRLTATYVAGEPSGPVDILPDSTTGSDSTKEPDSTAETVYTITVVPTPADAVDTYSWTSTDDESVKLTPSNGGKSCKVECLGAFGTQITLTCTSEINPEVTASVTLDYVKRLDSVNVSLNPAEIAFGSTETLYTVTATPVWGTGTITPMTFRMTGGTLRNNLARLTTVLSNYSRLEDMSYVRTATLKDFTFDGTVFSVTSPYDIFVSGTTTSSLPYTAFDSEIYESFATYPTETELESAYNNSVRTQAESTTGDGTLTVEYSYSYGDVVSLTTGTASIDVEFDVSGLVVSATGIALSENALVF